MRNVLSNWRSQGVAIAAGMGAVSFGIVPAAQAIGFTEGSCGVDGSKTFCLTNLGGLTWFQAQEYAISNGGRLATVSTSDENDVITGLMRDRGTGTAWLGGVGAGAPGSFSWAPESYLNLSLTEYVSRAIQGTLEDPEPIAVINSATGEAMDYWDSGEPNAAENQPPYGISIWGASSAFPEGSWHDLPVSYTTWNNAPIYSVIEFDNDTQGPTVGQLLLAGTAANQAANAGVPEPEGPAGWFNWASLFAQSFAAGLPADDLAELMAMFSNGEPGGLGGLDGMGGMTAGQPGSPLPPEIQQQILAAMNPPPPAPGGGTGGGTGAPGGPATPVPTPALLPGLLGFFWKLKRRQAKQDPALQEQVA